MKILFLVFYECICNNLDEFLNRPFSNFKIILTPKSYLDSVFLFLNISFRGSIEFIEFIEL